MADQQGDDLTGDELRRVLGLPAPERLGYFVAQGAKTGRVWTIGAGEELVVLAGEDDAPFIVAFPHPEFGEDWFDSADLDEVHLVSLKTRDWVDEVLPGLEEAGIQVLVFPTSEDEGSLMPAARAADLFSAE